MFHNCGLRIVRERMSVSWRPTLSGGHLSFLLPDIVSASATGTGPGCPRGILVALSVRSLVGERLYKMAHNHAGPRGCGITIVIRLVN
jgi:hypothetical protein